MSTHKNIKDEPKDTSKPVSHTNPDERSPENTHSTTPEGKEPKFVQDKVAPVIVPNPDASKGTHTASKTSNVGRQVLASDVPPIPKPIPAPNFRNFDKGSVVKGVKHPSK